MTKTIVIGGGVAGLATALLLAREGHEVELLERGPRLGGRVGLVERDGFRFDTGPSWYLMPRVFDHFFELLGTTTAEQLQLERLDPGYRVFAEPASSGERDAPITIPLGADRVRAAFEELEPGAGAAIERYLDSAQYTTDMAMRYFLYNPFTRPYSIMTGEVLRALPKLGKLLFEPLSSFIAKRFEHPALRQVLGYPAVFLGTNPAAAPSMYHLMSDLDLREGVLYPIGGFWRLIESLEAMAKDAGITIRTDADVFEITSRARRKVETDGRKRVVTGARWRDAAGVGHRSDADIVVSAADLHHTETALLRAEDRSYPETWWARRESGPGAVIVLLGVRGTLPEMPHHSLFFTRDWQANFDAIGGQNPRIPDPASIYVCKPSATDATVAPTDHENLFVLVPIPADPSLGGGGDANIERTADAAIDQIAEWADIPDLRERIVVRETLGPADFANDYHSWRGGILGPSHVLSQSAMFRAQNESPTVSGLYYAGATTAPGVGVPMCLISAEVVLKRIRGDHSPGQTEPRRV